MEEKANNKKKLNMKSKIPINSRSILISMLGKNYDELINDETGEWKSDEVVLG